VTWTLAEKQNVVAFRTLTAAAFGISCSSADTPAGAVRIVPHTAASARPRVAVWLRPSHFLDISKTLFREDRGENAIRFA